jgi:sulfonate transport system substrate-binding protein
MKGPIMHADRRQVLQWGAALIAGSVASGALAQAKPYPSAVRIAGGASSENGQIRLGGLAHVVNEQGWLRQQLAARSVGLEWFATAHAATGPMINEAFANESIDFASYGDLPSAILNARGIETRLVMPHGLGTGETFLVVPKRSTARSILDLKGQRLAIHRGRPWEMPFVRLLQTHGLKYSDFRLLNINPEAGLSAIASGQLDAMVTTQNAYLLEDKGLGRIIWSTVGEDIGFKYRTDFWAAKRFIDRWPDLTQAVVTAFVKAAHWASQPANEEAMIRIAANNGTPESVVRRSYADRRIDWRNRWSVLYNDVVAQHYRSTIEFALENKLIARPVNLQTWFEPRFAQAALKDLQLQAWWKPVSVVPAQSPARV